METTVTLNQVLDVDQHPLPKPSDLFATLAGGKVFSKLPEKFQHLLTITTHKGLYRYRRLPFGISSAPALFQRTMEQTLQGIPGVVAFMDDIELTGATEEGHLDRLDRGAGIAQWLERRTRDRKVAVSDPCWSGGRIFFSRVNFLC